MLKLRKMTLVENKKNKIKYIFLVTDLAGSAVFVLQHNIQYFINHRQRVSVQCSFQQILYLLVINQPRYFHCAQAVLMPLHSTLEKYLSTILHVCLKYIICHVYVKKILYNFTEP